MNVIQLYKKFMNAGKTAENVQDHPLVGAYNFMSLMSIFTISINFLAADYLGYPKEYINLVGVILSVYLLVIVFNFSNRFNISRYFVCLGSPIWICACMIFLGGFFCQGLAILATILIAFVSFKREVAKMLGIIIFNISFFLFAILFIELYGPVYPGIDFPFDEIGVLFGGLGWAIIVLYIYENNTTTLVANLRDNNLELVDKTKQLERFTYIASHDLKSPLRTILNFIGLIESDIENQRYDKLPEKFDFVKTGAMQMNYLIEGVLEMSLIENHETSTRIPTNLNKVYQKALKNLSFDIEKFNAKVYCTDLPMYTCNELEMIMLFQNIIQNGLKYNESPQPTVHVSCTENKEFIILTFEDNGIGIQEEYQEKIFDFFTRLHTYQKYKGTGLGLGLCKRIVNNYGGSISVDSVIEKGTKFRVVLKK